MRDFIDHLDRAAVWLSGLFARIAAVCAALMAAVVTFGVVMRFVFNDAQNWTDETATYCLLWMVFFGLAYTLSNDSHIRIDFITAALPRRVRHAVEIGVHAIGLVFCALLILGAISAISNFIKRDTHSTAGLDIPLWWPALPLLLGAIAFALIMLIRTLRCVMHGPDAAVPPADRKDMAV